jgi:hypothetical protein
MPGISWTVVMRKLAMGERGSGEECGPGFSILVISVDGRRLMKIASVWCQGGGLNERGAVRKIMGRCGNFGVANM